MKTKLKLAHPDLKTIADLCEVTGLSEPSVYAGIVRGELPGHKVGSRYVIPTEAFERFCRGDWKPEPRPQVFTPVKIGARQESIVSYPDIDHGDYPDGHTFFDEAGYDAYVEESLSNWNGMYDSMQEPFDDVPFDDPEPTYLTEEFEDGWWPVNEKVA